MLLTKPLCCELTYARGHRQKNRPFPSRNGLSLRALTKHTTFRQQRTFWIFQQNPVHLCCVCWHSKKMLSQTLQGRMSTCGVLTQMTPFLNLFLASRLSPRGCDWTVTAPPGHPFLQARSKVSAPIYVGVAVRGVYHPMMCTCAECTCVRAQVYILLKVLSNSMMTKKSFRSSW